MDVEICNDCGGLVGWDELRKDCCPGGVVCQRTNGTHFRDVMAVGKRHDETEPYEGKLEPDSAKPVAPFYHLESGTPAPGKI